MDAEGYPAQCAPGAGKGRVSASATKCRGAFVAAAGHEKLPAEPFLGALPGVSVAAKYSRMFNTVTSLSIYLFSLRHKLSDVFCSAQMGNSQLIFRLSAERFHIGTFNRIRKQFCLFFSRNQKVLFNTRSCYI